MHQHIVQQLLASSITLSATRPLLANHDPCTVTLHQALLLPLLLLLLLLLQVRTLESSGDLLDAQKLLLCAGAAMQDVGLMFHFSRAMLSAAQELRCLQVRCSLSRLQW
jgi:hypothetical protein